MEVQVNRRYANIEENTKLATSVKLVHVFKDVFTAVISCKDATMAEQSFSPAECGAVPTDGRALISAGRGCPGAEDPPEGRPQLKAAVHLWANSPYLNALGYVYGQMNVLFSLQCFIHLSHSCRGTVDPRSMQSSEMVNGFSVSL